MSFVARVLLSLIIGIGCGVVVWFLMQICIGVYNDGLGYFIGGVTIGG